MQMRERWRRRKAACAKSFTRHDITLEAIMLEMKKGALSNVAGVSNICLKAAIKGKMTGWKRKSGPRYIPIKSENFLWADKSENFDNPENGFRTWAHRIFYLCVAGLTKSIVFAFFLGGG